VKRLGINGARGGAMFFFGIIAFVFGLAFNSPWQIIPPPPRGLSGLNDFLPLEVWAYGWYVAAGFLIFGAFRKNQAFPLGVFACMLFVWFASYLTTAIGQVIDRGYTSLWFAVAIYGALLGAIVCIARMNNAPPSGPLTGEIELIIKDEGDDR
jgi:hypothetical protein